MQTSGLEKAKIQNLNEITEYISDSVVSTMIISKIYGSIRLVTIDKGEILPPTSSPFDTFIQIIDGLAEILIDQKPNILHAGNVIIIPAHSSHIIRATGRFKMILTVIKSGYGEGLV